MSLDITGQDTIYAQSTPLGLSALAIVRLSGDKILHIMKNIFPAKNNIKSFRTYNADLIYKNKLIDNIVFTYNKNPKSFTGQDMLEISCHGSQFIIQEIFGILKDLGARLAEPGEFSLRAVLNNKIDLAQAEGIKAMIHAQSLTAKDIALKNLRSGLSHKVGAIRSLIIELLAQMESRMDFPEDDLGSYDKNFLLYKLNIAIEEIEKILKYADRSLKLYEGARLVICGQPNAGKSTLLNAILGEDRAIVHATPGTTRDILESKIDLEGTPLTIVDVAGIRDLDEADSIEQIGIDKAKGELKKASIIIWLADANIKDPFSDKTIIYNINNLNIPILRVLNKIDNFHAHESEHLVADAYISAKNNINIELLLKKIKNIIIGEEFSQDDLFITKSRQKDELLICLSGLNNTYAALKDAMVDEVIASELRFAAGALDRLLGLKIDEEVLDKIFSEFCIGK